MKSLYRRWWGLLLGAVSLFYLTIENENPLWAIALAAFWMLWLFPLHPEQPWRGVLILFAVPWLAALVMIFKNGVHGHAVPDFPNAVIFATLARSPWWGIAGGMIGLAWRWTHAD